MNIGEKILNGIKKVWTRLGEVDVPDDPFMFAVTEGVNSGAISRKSAQEIAFEIAKSERDGVAFSERQSADIHYIPGVEEEITEKTSVMNEPRPKSGKQDRLREPRKKSDIEKSLDD